MNKLKALILAGASVALSYSINAQVLISDNFNSENGGVGVLNYNSFANWTVANTGTTGGTVDLIGNGFFDFYPGSGLYVDLDGSGNGTPGQFQSKTTFNFVPGVEYNLSFDLGGSQRGIDSHVDVSLGSIISETLFLPSTQGLTLFSQDFTVSAPTSATLDFMNEEPGDEGAILDNVSLTGASSVPDGGNTALLAGIAFLALAAAAARSRKSAIAAN
jgi:hypothetical protein